MNRRGGLITVSLLVLAGLSTWLTTLVEPKEGPKESNSANHSPDFFLENSTITAMDATGKPRYRLQSTTTVHFPDDESTELTNPHLTIYKQQSPPWTVVAEHGWVAEDGEFVVLRGGVVVDRPKGDEKPPFRLTTTELRVRPREEYAETDKPVLMVSEGYTAEAVGMRAYLKQGKMELLSQVRGKFQKIGERDE